MRFARPLALLAAALAALVLPSATRATAPALLLDDCVHIPDIASARTKAGNATVLGSVDLGNLTVIELDGDYSRSLDAPRMAVAQRFYATHADQYDFLVTFTTFEFETGTALAFYTALRNDVRGIGTPLLDFGQHYGSAARLQGYIDMAATSRYAFVPGETRYRDVQTTLAHEIMHRWGARVSYRTPAGETSRALIGREGSHWSYFLDTDASLMYGADWSRRSDGRYESVAVRQRFSPLDLYLAGFAAASEVPAMNLITGGDGNALDLPRLGAVSGGTGETVAIDQIIAAEGPRIPAAAQAPKDFRAALILIKRPGETVPPATLAALEGVRIRLQQFFNQATDGRASLRLYNEPLAESAQLPSVLSGSGTAAAPPGIAAAVDWIKQRQQADGHWQDRAATAVRDTAAAVQLLAQVDPSWPGLGRARDWLAAQTPANRDQQGWQLIASAQTASTALLGAQSSAGGWSLAAGLEDSTLDTAHVADALARRDADGDAVRRALTQLGSRQNSDGSFALAASGRGRLLPTLRATRVFGTSTQSAHLTIRDAAVQWLASRRRADGSFGDSGTLPGDSTLADTIELYSLVGRLPLPALAADSARGYVIAAQQTAGDWQGSVYLTASAALARLYDNKPNLAAAAAPSVLPADAIVGDMLTLQVRVANTGAAPTPASLARWYDGDPAQGGIAIGADQPVPALSAGATALLQQSWDSSGHSGPRTLWLLLDAGDAIAEQNESDNRIAIPLNVATAPAQADIALDAARFTLTPPALAQLPSTIQLSGQVRNAGGTAVSAARLALYDEANPPRLLATASLDLPAGTAVPLQLEFAATTPAALRLRLVADPDNQVAEARENNNEAQLVLPFGPSLDLEVLPSDLALLDGAATQGRDVSLRVRARNRGTLSANNAALRVVLQQGAAEETLLDTRVTLDPGQTLERRLYWRARQTGAASLNVVLDAANEIAELDENNNTAQLPFTIVAGSGSDLAIVSDSLQFTPLPALQGQPLQLSLRLRNLGAEASPGSTLALYASDPRSGGTRIAQVVIPGIAAGGETSAVMNVAELGLAGDTPVYVAADADQQIAESDESNNLALHTLNVLPFADIAVSSAGMTLVPSQPAAGTAQQVQALVRNLGAQAARNVVVRLFEGNAENGVAVGNDQLIAELAAGAETTLSWSWAFGLQPGARQLSLVADATAQVRENQEGNNLAILPLLLQDAGFYASERYFSPNGDGVRDATALFLARDGTGRVDVLIRNGAGRIVRRYDEVLAASANSGQLVWDGRDQRGRVVADGVYIAERVTAGQVTATLSLSVDTDRSSLIAAIDTPLLADAPLPPERHWFQPPATAATRDTLFARSRSNNPLETLEGLYRTNTVAPELTAVLSARWLHNFLGTAQGRLDTLDAQQFSPDGRWIAFYIERDYTRALAVAATDQTDQVIVLDAAAISVEQGFRRQQPRFLDANRVIGGAFPQLYIYNLQTRTRTPLRPMPDDSAELRAFAHGYYVWRSPISEETPPSYYVPQDTQRSIVSLPTAEQGQQLSIRLNPDGTRAVIRRFANNSETLHLFRTETGTETLLKQYTPVPHTFPALSEPGYLPSLDAQWISADDSLLVIDALARQVQIVNRDGAVRASAQLPPTDSSLDLGPDPERFDSGHRRADTLHPSGGWLSSDRRRQWFDPATRQAVVLLASEHIGPVACEAGRCFGHEPATLEAFAIDVDDGSQTRIAGVQQTTQLPADLQPRLRLVDTGAFTSDSRYGYAGRWSSRPWRYREAIENLAPAISGDDANLIAGNGTAQPRAITALVNLSAQLWAEPSGRAVRLSGVAADINFAYYTLDWALPAAPTQWQAITPPQDEPVLGDEFLSWIPPSPGQYLVRLRVVDKAGNTTTRIASALSSFGSPVFELGLDSRYFSPNGDGVKDVATLRYRLTTNAQIALRIRNALGQVVREQDALLSAGPQQFIWDGRNDGGQALPDGDYVADVAGQTLKISLDTTPPVFTGWLEQPNLPFDDGVAPTPDYTDQLNVVGAATDRHFDYLRYETRPLAGGDWQEAPHDAKGNLLQTGYRGLAGKALRAAAYDRAGNRTLHELGGVVEQLLFANCSGGNCSARHVYKAPSVGAVSYPADFPTAVELVIDDPDQVELWLQDGSAGLASIDIEIADTSRPGEWSVFATLPGTQAPFVFAHRDRGIRLSLPWRNLPQGADRRLRAVGIRSDGSRLYGDQLRVRTSGLATPIVFCPGVNTADVAPPEVRELLTSYSDDLQVVVPVFYDGIAAAVQLRLGARPDAIASGNYRMQPATAYNARHAYFRLPRQSAATIQAVLAGAGRVAESEITENRCGPGDTSDGSKQLQLGASPVLGERCAGVPTQRWRFVAGAEFVMQHYELALVGANGVHPLLNETPTRNDRTPSDPPWLRTVVLSTAGFAEGRYLANAVADNGPALRFSGSRSVEIDHDPPQAELDWPSSGSRYCATLDARSGYPALRLGSVMRSDSTVSYQFALKSNASDIGTVCPGSSGLLSSEECKTRYPAAPDLLPRELAGYGPAVADLNGRVTAELEVANASGAVVCSTTTFDLDSVAELGLGGAPEPQTGTLFLLTPRPEGEPRAESHKPVLGLSRNGAPRFRNATIPLIAREPLDYRASLHALITVLDNGATRHEVGNELSTLAQGQQISGAFTVSWNGQVSGNPAADGYYVIRVQASDACGWTATRYYVVDVDSTPPVLAITAPAAGAVPQDAVVAISGSVDDAHFSSFPAAQPYWQLSVEHSGSSQLLAEDDEPVPQPAVLGRWSRGTVAQAGRYLLRASDDFGNSAEFAQAFAAPQPLAVLGGASAVPELFSPNADGRLDQTQLRLQLLVPARVDLRVLDAGGAVVAELAQNVAMNAGTARLDWNGGGLADGRYRVDIVARDAAAPAIAESGTLALTLDTAAPVISVLTPAGGHASSRDSVTFRVEDTHLDRYDAQLVAAGSGAIVARLGGGNDGVQTLTALDALATGDYQLRVTAQDGAGNRREVTQSFTLDKTSPEAALTAPAAASVLPRAAAPQVLLGSASDTHLRDYRVELVPAGSESGAVIASGNSPVTAAALGQWVVTQADGDYRLRLRVRDLAGNEASAEQTIAIDGTPPAIVLSSPANGAAIAGRLLLQGSVRDAHLRDYQIAVATPSAALADQWTPLYRGLAGVDAGTLADLDLPLPDGDYVLRVRASDVTGAQTDARLDLRLDRSAPPAPLQLRLSLQGSDAVLDWSAPDAADLAGYAVYRNGARLNPALVTAPRHVDSALQDGLWRYEVSAIDRAGNESPRSNRVEATLDRTPPQVDIHAPLAASRVHGVVPVLGTAWSSDDFDSYSLSARRSDGSGASVVLAQGGLPQRDALLAHWDSLAFAQDSAVTLRLLARDRSGNEAAREIEVIVDNLAPAAPQGLNAVLQAADGVVSWNPNSETDLLGYLLYRNGRLVNGPAQLPQDLRGYALPDASYRDAALPDGTHRYVVFAIDQAGNISAASDPAELGPVDNGPPHLRIDAPENGISFETTLDVRASSNEGDIASVQFAYRAAGASSWTTLGTAQTEAPYRIRWTPGELPLGEYDIRALALDNSGLSDPQPPQVRVRYADLTAPAGPGALSASADGATVNLQWTASNDASVVAYRVEADNGSGWQQVGDDAAGNTRSHPGRADGRIQYRVRALDAAGNLSDAASDEAQVFSLSLEQPFTPTAQATVTLQGRSAVPGQLSLRIGEGAEENRGATSGDGRFTLPDLALASGESAFTLRVTTADGDRSRAATRWVRRASAPAAPTGLQASAAGYEVSLNWNANSEPDLLGYRVEHNGGSVRADDTLTGLTPGSTTCCGAEGVADGNLDTWWDITTTFEPASAEAGSDPLLEIDLGSAAVVSALEFDWRDAGYASGNLDIYAHAGHEGWVRLLQSRSAAAATHSVALPEAYRTDRLRIAVRSPTGNGGYARLTLAEVRVRAWHLLTTTTLQQTVLDGQHRYRVAAVNNAALQSPWSAPAEVGIGDTTPPDPVVLSGTLDGNNATLSWTASTAADVARYRLLRNGAVLAELAASAERRHVDANLALGSYAYEVIALDAFGNASSASNRITLVVAGSGPGIPRDLSVSAAPQGGLLQLSWRAGEGSTPLRYVLRRALAADGSYSEIASIATASYSDAPLNNGTRYFYTVEAVDAAGNRSGTSAAASGVPRDTLPPPAPVLTYPTADGGPLAIHTDRSLICGRAEPGSQIEIWRDGSAIVTATAAASLQSRDYPTAGSQTYSPLRLAADGWHLADADNGLRIVDLRTEQVETVAAQARLPQWSARGLTLYYLSGEQLFAKVQNAAPQALPFTAQAIRNYAVSADETRLLFYGRHGGSTNESLWWIRRDGSAARAISGLTDYPLAPDELMHLRDDGRYAALATSDGRFLIVDLDAGRVHSSIAADTFVWPRWSPDGRLVVARSGNSERTLWRYDLVTRAADPWLTLPDSAQAFAWSPDRSEISVLHHDRIEGRSALDGTLRFDAPAPVNGNNTSTFLWSASGHIAVIGINDIGVTRLYTVQPPGAFCAGPVALRAGSNGFSATATDAGGNRSSLSPPLTLTLDGAALPDLSVSSEDLFFVPAAPVPGQAVTVLASVRNRGSAAASGIVLEASLRAPDGSSRTLAAPAPFALAAGQAQALSFNLGTLTQSGVYRLSLRVDPANAIGEADERNNTAEAQLALSDSAEPLLDVALSSSLLAPDALLSGAIHVSNPGALFSGRLQAEILADDGLRVADLGERTITDLATGQTFSRNLDWNSRGVLAGDYHLRTRLLRGDGTLAAERSAPFTIEALRRIDLALSATPAQQTLGLPVEIESRLQFAAGNALLAGASLRVSVHTAAGSEVWNATQALGTLAPGYQLRKVDTWTTQGAAAGSYSLRLRLSAPGYEASTESSLQLAEPGASPRLTGALAFAPGVRLVAGQPGELIYRADNAGTAPTDLQLRLRVLRAASLSAVFEREESIRLEAGASREQRLALAVPPLALEAYVAVLDARLPGDTAGLWRDLARQGFSVVDELAPVIAQESPAPPQRQPALVTLSARITDAHSEIAQAQARIDGGQWQPLALDANGRWSLHLSGLADGAHSLTLRARDAWGNESLGETTAFEVDATAPQVSISGVDEGALTNQIVTLTVTISDSYLDTARTTLRLNGQPYVSGTPVTADGAYTLSVQAYDTAGNLTLASRHFTLDRTAPGLTITSPADGSNVNQSAVDVSADSEAGARVTLTAGAYQAERLAEANGRAHFAAVPLVEGDNRIDLVATDAAGNTSATRAVTVRFESQTAQPLIGTVQPAQAELPHGSALEVVLQLRNPGTVALATQSLRLRILAADGSELAQRSYARPFAGGEIFSDTASFASTAWPLGNTRVALEIQRDGNWQPLDTQNVLVVDRSAPLLQALAPLADAVLAAPLRLRATASDVLSPPVAVDARVDGGPWSALSSTAADTFESTALKLADGAHDYRLRARDAAGNETLSAVITFSVDSTAPQITIDGVADGALLNQAVTPQITVSDAHLRTSTLSLNGQPYVAGTAIAASGSYTLRVEADDSAGNTAVREIRFTLDRDAPTVVVSEPVPGSTVTDPAQDVAGSTEPEADVAVEAPGLTTVVRADANGNFRTAAATLQPGANSLRLRATDRAGNIGEEVRISVTYTPPAGETMAAQFTAAAISLRRGDPLQVDYTLRNSGTLALSAAPVRLQLQADGGGAALAQEDYSISLNPGAEVARRSTFATDTLTLGAYRIELSASLRNSQGQSQWTVLASLPVQLRSCAAGRPLDLLFRNGFQDGLEDLLFCHDFETLPPKHMATAAGWLPRLLFAPARLPLSAKPTSGDRP
ncbi:MAG: Ig-like domain repeat protein [Rhodanobacteraceae bacterium]|nr:Ig-like domain repeat protein [Rhodanobacteraceae bacterium]